MPDVTPPSPVNPFKKMQAAAKRSSTFALTAIALALLAGVLAWFSWKEAHRVTTQVKTYVNQLSQQAGTSTQAIEKTISELQAKLNGFETKINDVDNKLSELSNISVQAHNQRALNMVNHLVHMANLQLLVSQNTDAALSLMHLAEKQLKEITTPKVLPLKTALAKAIIALKNAPKLDVAALLAQLDQLKTDVLKLPAIPQKHALKAPAHDADKTKAVPWYKKLGHNLGTLKQLVIIRHTTKPVTPLLSPEQLLFLKENIQLKISEAEWAVLYRNQSLYQQSLETAKQLLERYYPDQEAMHKILNALTSLSKININPKLPDLTNTINILNTTSIHASRSSGAGP